MQLGRLLQQVSCLTSFVVCSFFCSLVDSFVLVNGYTNRFLSVEDLIRYVWENDQCHAGNLSNIFLHLENNYPEKSTFIPRISDCNQFKAGGFRVNYTQSVTDANCSALETISNNVGNSQFLLSYAGMFFQNMVGVHVSEVLEADGEKSSFDYNITKRYLQDKDAPSTVAATFKVCSSFPLSFHHLFSTSRIPCTFASGSAHGRRFRSLRMRLIQNGQSFATLLTMPTSTAHRGRPRSQSSFMAAKPTRRRHTRTARSLGGASIIRQKTAHRNLPSTGSASGSTLSP